MEETTKKTPALTVHGGRQIIFLSAVFYLLSVAVWLLDLAGVSLPTLSLSFPLILGVLSTAVGALIITGARLEVFGPAENTPSDNEILALREELGRVRQALAMSDPKVDDASLRKIVKEVATSEIANAAKDAIVADYSVAIVEERKTSLIAKKGDEFLTGLYRQIENQRISANSNLVWGIAFGVLGLMFMGGFIIYPIISEPPRVWNGSAYVQAPVVEHSWTYFVQQFFPRLTFVLIFESLSFFFLRAYGQDRTMMRFLRNEATNVEAKIMALLTSLHFGDPSAKTHSIKALMATERNFTIGKGEKLIHEVFSDEQSMWIEKIGDRLIPMMEKAVAKSSPSKSRSKAVAAQAEIV
ncbi:hypothetical protein [Ensifer sp.]|jgi:hypothetical protein|uniref:hypothetical protein n=1 Tax=Ensifer sp. TaxID=1872086 RepID=UPI002E1199AB|nr:hypothetical protein [Ensifer sp.]